MEVVVNDANLFFDLLNAGLIDPFFKLPFEFYTTDFVLGEVTDSDQLSFIEEYIKSGQLKVYVSDFETTSQIFILNQQVQGLSLPDCSVWYYSKKNEQTLLTGDKLLRDTAMNDNIVVRGLLYIFDKLVELDFLLPLEAKAKLQFLIDNGTRLPSGECTRRIEKWKNGEK